MYEVFQRQTAAWHFPPIRLVGLTALTSSSALLITTLLHFPLWGVGLAVLLPVIPLLTGQLSWTYRHFGWLALFYFLAIVQTGHAGEHLAIMVQLHVLHWPMKDTHGIFGTLDTEWVHFIFNTWVFIMVLILLTHFRQNPWLRVGAVICGWHTFEHFYIMNTYLQTGVSGTPGLLSKGGFHGGLPFNRADVHAFFNVIETIPLVGSFLYELQRRYDRALATAFPEFSTRQLIKLTRRSRVQTYTWGSTVVQQGQLINELFVITRGEAEVTRSNGNATHVATLTPGQCFGLNNVLHHVPCEYAVTARSNIEVLGIDCDTFREVAEESKVSLVSREQSVPASAAVF